MFRKQRKNMMKLMKNKNYIRALLLYFMIFQIICLNIPNCLFASQENIGLDKKMEDKLRFYGDSFFQEQDYYRAITFYQLATFNEPENKEQVQYCKYKTGQSYQFAERWDEAVHAFKQAETAMDNTPLAEESAFRIGQSYFLGEKFSFARSQLGDLQERYTESEWAPRAQYMIAISHLRELNGPEAVNAFITYSKKYPDDNLAERAERLAEEAAYYKDLPSKSPGLAAALSIVPGLGQLYCKHYGDAVMSLLINGVFGYLLYDAIEKEDDIKGNNYTGAVMIGFLGSAFYLGNIYGAANSAVRFNRNTETSFYQNLENRAFVPGIGLKIDF
jgi:tetratricopeptide (TPR) repeat protein